MSFSQSLLSFWYFLCCFSTWDMMKTYFCKTASAHHYRSLHTWRISIEKHVAQRVGPKKEKKKSWMKLKPSTPEDIKHNYSFGLKSLEEKKCNLFEVFTPIHSSSVGWRLKRRCSFVSWFNFSNSFIVKHSTQQWEKRDESVLYGAIRLSESHQKERWTPILWILRCYQQTARDVEESE